MKCKPSWHTFLRADAKLFCQPAITVLYRRMLLLWRFARSSQRQAVQPQPIVELASYRSLIFGLVGNLTRTFTLPCMVSVAERLRSNSDALLDAFDLAGTLVFALEGAM